MSSEDQRVKKLFADWVEHRLEGKPTFCVEELCADDPDLLEPLRERIRLFEGLEATLDARGPSLVGATLGHYRIEEKLGEGGMGQVYAAHDTQLQRRVAVKVLPNQTEGDAERLRRFHREARALAALNHPHIITIHDFGQHGQQGVECDFIVMELVEGRSLGDLIGDMPLPTADVLRFALQTADALSAAHQAGIVHRDLKPANIMITENE